MREEQGPECGISFLCLLSLLAQGRERSGLAKLAVLMVFQVGLDCPDIQRSLHPLGTMLAQDTTIFPSERAEVSGEECTCW